jgi:G3E family GTPase
VGGFDLDRATELDPHFLEPEGGHHHHHHEHDAEIKSVGIESPGDLNLEKFNEWLSELLTTRGPDIFRLKGVVSLKGQDRRHVFQGVHMQLDSRPDRPWGAEPRTNKLIFIGRNLDRQALNDGFRKCLA